MSINSSMINWNELYWVDSSLQSFSSHCFQGPERIRRRFLCPSLRSSGRRRMTRCSRWKTASSIHSAIMVTNRARSWVRRRQSTVRTIFTSCRPPANRPSIRPLRSCRRMRTTPTPARRSCATTRARLTSLSCYRRRWSKFMRRSLPVCLPLFFSSFII